MFSFAGAMALVLTAFYTASAAEDRVLLLTEIDVQVERRVGPNLGLASGQSGGGEDAIQLEELFITGTRITRTGFTTPTPVTAIDNERLDNLAISNIGEGLNQLPSFVPSLTPASLGFGNQGIYAANLRGLGPERNLVLVNGRRHVATGESGLVDLNMIPSMMVERTEVVTGGASAAYGSDAVAGVVNIILDTDLQGIRGNVEYGVSQRGDNENYQFSLAGGTDLFDGRGHIVAGAEYENYGGTGDCYTREWCSLERQTVVGSGSPDRPAWNVVDHVHAAFMAPGGLIAGVLLPGPDYDPGDQISPTGSRGTISGAVVPGGPGVLGDTQFTPDGDPVPFIPGEIRGALFMAGGSGHAQNPFFKGTSLLANYDRLSSFTHFEYDFSGSLRGWAEASFGQVTARNNHANGRFSGVLPGSISAVGQIVINVTNPFIPDPVRETMEDEGYVGLTMGRAGLDTGNMVTDTDRHTYRFATGLEGDISETWNWDVYYQYGKTASRVEYQDNRNNERFAKAVDAVQLDSGQIVCRVTRDNPAQDDGCLPFNIFGENNWTQDSYDYIYGTSWTDTHLDQHTIAANVQGDVIDLWAGPLTLAAGLEYRQESVNVATDEIAQEDGWYVANSKPVDGKYKIKEGYAEIALPLAQGAPLAQSLDLNAAIRYTDYQADGSVTVDQGSTDVDESFHATTWKLGLTYEPARQVRLRVTRSRDIRAPGLDQIFGPQSTGLGSVVFNGVNSFTTVITGGSPNLQPEKADTWTGGVVLQPEWGPLSGLGFSVDYWSIKLKDAIGTIGATNTVANCQDGIQEFCDLITFNEENPNTINQIVDTLQNINKRKVEGLDFELDYLKTLGGAGDLNLRVLATRIFDDKYFNLGTVVDRAGQTGFYPQSTPGQPKWLGDITATWSKGPLSITTHGRYIHKGKFDNTLIGPDEEGYDPTLPNSINDNTISARFIINLSAHYNLVPSGDGDYGVRLYGRVTNLFDQDPPPTHASSPGTNQVYFNPEGRAFKMGLRFKY